MLQGTVAQAGAQYQPSLSPLHAVLQTRMVCALWTWCPPTLWATCADGLAAC
jgi:hypothetical protein